MHHLILGSDIFGPSFGICLKLLIPLKGVQLLPGAGGVVQAKCLAVVGGGRGSSLTAGKVFLFLKDEPLFGQVKNLGGSCDENVIGNEGIFSCFNVLSLGHGGGEDRRGREEEKDEGLGVNSSEQHGPQILGGLSCKRFNI